MGYTTVKQMFLGLFTGNGLSYPMKGTLDPETAFLTIPNVAITNPATGAALTLLEATSDAINPTNVPLIGTEDFNLQYEPTAGRWERKTGNYEFSALASAARTATINSADFTNRNCRGLHLFINVSAYPAAASVVPTIEGKDPVSGTYYPVLTGSAIVATGYTVLKVYPGIGEIANGAASDILPRTWRVTMTHANADSITYSVGAMLVV